MIINEVHRVNKDIKRLPVERKGVKPADFSRDIKMDRFFDRQYNEKKAVRNRVRFSSSNTYGKNNFEDWLHEFFQNPKEFIYRYSRKVKGFNG